MARKAGSRFSQRQLQPLWRSFLLSLRFVSIRWIPPRMALGPVLGLPCIVSVRIFWHDGERGEIKLTPEPRTVDPKLAEVCVNNGFAGTAGQLNNMCSNQELTNCRF